MNAKHYIELTGEDYGISKVCYLDSVANAGTLEIFSPNNVQPYNWIPVYYPNGYGDPLGVAEIIGGSYYIW